MKQDDDNLAVGDLISQAVEQVRAVWGLFTALGGVAVLILYPWWAIPIYALCSVGTYFGSIYLTGIYLGYLLQGRSDSAKPLSIAPPGSLDEDCLDASLKEGGVVAVGEIFGHYLDQPMYEWVDVMVDKETKRYVYSQVTPRDMAGNLFLPEGDFACIGWLTYMRAQPA